MISIVVGLIFVLILVLHNTAYILADCLAIAAPVDLVELMGRFQLSELTITQADQGKSFEVNQGDVIMIRLPENPGTGYRWAIDQMDDEILEFQSSGFSPASEAGIGGSGQRTFSFNAKTTGAVQICLKNQRDWQGDKSIAEWFNVTIQVRE